MKIVGGNGQGADNEKTRIIEIEPGDVGKQFQVHCHPVADGGSEGNDLWVTYYEDGPSGRKRITVDDPIEDAEPPAPFWKKLCQQPPANPQAAEKAQGPAETWERLLLDLAEDTRVGMVSMVAEATFQETLINLWALEARKRLIINLVDMKLALAPAQEPTKEDDNVISVQV